MDAEPLSHIITTHTRLLLKHVRSVTVIMAYLEMPLGEKRSLSGRGLVPQHSNRTMAEMLYTVMPLTVNDTEDEG